MKPTKFLSILLILASIVSLFSFTALAADDLVKGELICNGDFELYGTSFGKWSGSPENVMFGLAHSGNRSMKLADAKQEIHFQKVFNIEPGQEYTFSAWLYVEELLEASADVGGSMKIEFYGDDKPAGGAKYECFPGEYGKWTKCEISAVAPAGADTLVAFLRIDCGGVIYWDDASVVGAVKKDAYDAIAAERDMAASAYAHSQELLAETFAKDEKTVIATGAVNPVVNPSFEEPGADGTGAKGWDPFKGAWNTVISITDEEAHSGQYSAKITGTPDTYNPWVKQNVQSNFVAGTTYVLSAWVKPKKIDPLNSVFMKVEFYGAGTQSGSTYISSAESNNYQFADAEWHPMKMVFTMPENVSVAVMYLRTSTGNAEIYYDDVELGPAASSNVMSFTPKFIINYTDVPNIETVTTINYINKPIETGSTVEYTVKDGDSIVVQEAVPAAATINWSFPTEKLTKAANAYTIEAAYKKADGTVIEATDPQNIFRYDRPPVFDDQNRIIVDGKPLDVVLLYGAKSQFFQDYVDAGVTVIRIDDIASPANRLENIPEYRRLMDEAHSYGLKVIFALYGRVAGHPFQLPTTRKLVEEFKDHPALVAWMLCDEPCYNFGPGMMAQSYAEMLEYLEEGYKVVREIDPYHAAFICECTSQPNSYDYTFKYADIACVDIYPKYNNETFVTYRDTSAAVASVYDKKEIWNLGYASTWDPAYVPDDDALRMQNYLTVWAGGSGFGYYTNDDFSPIMLESLKKSKDTGEMHQMFDHFVRGNSPVFDEYLGNDYWHRSWVDKNGRMYLVVKEHKNDGKNTEVNFNLKSTNGLIEINGYTAKLVNGTTDKIVTSEDSSFKLTMTPTQISLYEIIPNNPVDFSALSTPVYGDLAGFEWAQDAIMNITRNKIANNKGKNIYAPGENITRGDFAMYLIRALGLTAEPADQFTDVDPNAEYAKEVAIGKALGILKGSGDGTYGPEEPISRQDLMVICARGMRMARRLFDTDYKTVLSSFTDTGLIADYATNDIGAMVSAKIVTGNPDLTINPLGNTTRAEAAVIMDRIAH